MPPLPRRSQQEQASSSRRMILPEFFSAEEVLQAAGQELTEKTMQKSGELSRASSSKAKLTLYFALGSTYIRFLPFLSKTRAAERSKIYACENPRPPFVFEGAEIKRDALFYPWLGNCCLLQG